MQKIHRSANEWNRSFCKARTDCSFPISVSILVLLFVKGLNLSSRDPGFAMLASTYVFLIRKKQIVGPQWILQKFKYYAVWMMEDFLPHLSLSLELYLHIWNFQVYRLSERQVLEKLLSSFLNLSFFFSFINAFIHPALDQKQCHVIYNCIWHE